MEAIRSTAAGLKPARGMTVSSQPAATPGRPSGFTTTAPPASAPWRARCGATPSRRIFAISRHDIRNAGEKEPSIANLTVVSAVVL
jgi:hypothetical protein